MRIALIAAALCTAAVLPRAGAAQDLPFDRLGIHLERNLSDRDVEARFAVTAGLKGLASLQVVAPDGRTLIDFRAPGSKLGIRHLGLESPEPVDDGIVQTDFPAGRYAFSGRSTSGAVLAGAAVLSHEFPEVAALIRPRPEATGIPIRGFTPRWHSAPGVVAHILVIEHEASGRALRVDLSGATTAFTVPEGFLEPASEYKLAIGTVAGNGNASFVETTFTTAKP
jgi:hypothetical protein